MIRKFEIGHLHCLCCRHGNGNKIAYILYPADTLARWIETAAETYGTTIIAVTGMAWQDAMSPWPAKGVPEGSPDFKGESPALLDRLRLKVIPEIEPALGFGMDVERTLVGVSMSGLFALWQWMQCDMFQNIASLSGSFWYEGFIDWVKHIRIPRKTGMAYFLLGNRESESKVKAFTSVAENTREIVSLLEKNGIRTEYQCVPGDHYSNPLPRLDSAFSALYGEKL